MPIYDYKCPLCNWIKEDIYKERRHHKCPRCGEPMKRLYNGSVKLEFKGSGFHANDYKDK